MVSPLNSWLPVALRPYAKALVPGLLTIVAVIVEWAIRGFDGDFNKVQFWTAVTGLGASFYIVLVANSNPALRYAEKALLPAVGTVLLVLVEWGKTGVFNQQELATAVTGLIAAGVIYLVPNTEVPSPVVGSPETHPIPEGAVPGKPGVPR